MEFSAKQIAEFVGGKVEGDELATVNSFAKIEEGKKGAISFLSNMKYLHYIYDTESSIVLVDDAVTDKGYSYQGEKRLRGCGKAAATVPVDATKEKGYRLSRLYSPYGKGGKGLLHRTFRGYWS